jgi:hypothetical protein
LVHMLKKEKNKRKKKKKKTKLSGKAPSKHQTKEDS